MCYNVSHGLLSRDLGHKALTGFLYNRRVVTQTTVDVSHNIYLLAVWQNVCTRLARDSRRHQGVAVV